MLHAAISMCDKMADRSARYAADICSPPAGLRLRFSPRAGVSVMRALKHIGGQSQLFKGLARCMYAVAQSVVVVCVLGEFGGRNPVEVLQSSH